MSTLNHGYGFKLKGLSASDIQHMHMLKFGYAVELDPYFGEGCRILPHSIVHEGHIEMKSTSTCELRTADGQKRV